MSAALQSLARSGAITATSYQQDYAAYVAAKRSLARLSGTRRSELAAVLSNLQAIAASGGFIPSRLPVLFLTLERNRRWWTTEPLLSSGVRVSFPGSKLVWEYYAGQGIEIQWLGTFGEANGYYLSGHENANLRQLLSEVLPLATKRAGGIAWEYLFQFDGGLPPWTSGLSQGTALQVLARAWSRFKEPALLSAAQQALGVFQRSPSTGVRVKTAAGAHYAEYTYAPSDRILNGFIQADVGLYDYASITKDPLGLQLFEAGDAEARAEVPRYDTGAWSLYDQFGESNLNYHELLTEFLQHLCERTVKDFQSRPPRPRRRRPPPHDDHTDHAHADDPVRRNCTRERRERSALRGAERVLGRDEHVDRWRSDLLHHGAALHHLPTHPAGDHAAEQDAARRYPRGRADRAVEGLDRAPERAPGHSRRVEQQRDPRARQAAAAVDDTGRRGNLHSNLHRHRPRGQLQQHERDDRGGTPLA